MMEIYFSKQAARDVSSLNEREKERILNGIEGIPAGDIRKLRGTDNLYRLRIGGYRIIYHYISAKEIVIVRVSPRGDVYKGGLFS